MVIQRLTASSWALGAALGEAEHWAIRNFPELSRQRSQPVMGWLNLQAPTVIEELIEPP